jgi:hypothetical protein
MRKKIYLQGLTLIVGAYCSLECSCKFEGTLWKNGIIKQVKLY